MAADGSVVLDVDMNVSDAEKKLKKLTGDIEKREQQIKDITKKRDEAKQKSILDAAELDAEKAKLQEIKDRLADIKAMSKDKSLSLEERDNAKTLISSVQDELKEQQARVTGLQSAWNKVENAVDRYNQRIAEAESKLDQQKTAAGVLTQEIDEATKSSMIPIFAKAEEKLGFVLENLQKQQTAVIAINEALGDVVDTQTKLIGLSEEFAIGAKIGFAALAKVAIASINKGISSLADKVPKISEVLKNIPKNLSSAFSKSKDIVKSFGESLIGATKNLRLFSKTSGSAGKSISRLGQMIKRVFVFSVITSGLRMMREQMSSYLGVNAQLSSALQQLKGVLLTAFQPIYDVIVPALTTLMNVLSRVIAVVSQFTAVLFGTTAKQAQKNAQALYNQANALEETGSAAEEAAGSLAGFDEINTIQTEKQSGGGAAADAGAGPLFDWEYEDTPFPDWGEAFDALLDKLIAGIPHLKETFKGFAEWLNDLAQKLYDMFKFPGVLEKVKQLGKDLAGAFNNLVNWIKWELLGRTLGAGLNLALNFLTSFIYEFDWINLGNKLAKFINGLVYEIDWYEFGRLLWAKFKIALETFAGFILGLDMPELAKSASEIVMGFFNSMTETLNNIDWEGIGEQVRTFLTGIDWLGIMKSVSEAISSALSSSSDFFTGVLGEEVKEQIRDILITVSKATLALGAILALSGINIPLGLSLLEIGAATLAATAVLDWGYISSNIQKILGEILAIAGGALLGLGLLLCLTGVNLPLGIALVAAGAAGLVTAAALNWNAIKDALSNMWSGIKSWWGSSNGPGRFLTLDYWKDLGKNMIDGLLAGLKGIFSGLSSWASSVWSTITGVFSGNNAKASISGAAAGTSAAIGRSSVQMAAIPQISTAQIPRLARGAVIPPNREFMAVLGDQRSGNNLEAPEGLIRQIVREEVAGAIGSSSNNRPIEVKVMLDKKVLARAMVNEVNSMTVQAGRPVLLI